MSRMVEDQTFKYAGYARVSAGELGQGDGVRFGDGGPCWLVVTIEAVETGWVAWFADRAAHVESVMSTVFGRPVGEMRSDVDGTHMRTFGPDDEVWVRL